MVKPIPANSAALSPVPKVAMAKSLSHGGVKSMKVEPSAITGAARAVKNAPISSATERTTAAAATPASAARKEGALKNVNSFCMPLVRSGRPAGLFLPKVPQMGLAESNGPDRKVPGPPSWP
jgi:hypothetical protein